MTPFDPRRPLSVYYGPATTHAVRTLGGFDRAVVHPTLYAAADLRALRHGGTCVLAYLSVGEDHAFGNAVCVPGSAPYHHAVNGQWGSVTVDAAHPGWRSVLLARAEQVLAHTDGLLLDTLDSAEPAATLDLVAAVRHFAPTASLMVNRGFGLLPGLTPLVQSVLFEAFSTTHSPRLAAHGAEGLAYTAHWLALLRASGLDVLALDYATTPKLAAFARRRAAQYSLPTFVSDRTLTLPGGYR